jgi:general secretion pathway protein G
LNRRLAFTLVELLVSLAIIILLVSITIPIVGKVRESSHSTECQSNLRQMFVATQLWSLDNSNKLPTRSYQFYTQIWPYAYPERADALPIQWGNPPETLKHTIFECPSVYDDDLAVKRSYGINRLILADSGNLSWPLYMHQIETPEKTVCYGDVEASSELNPVYSLPSFPGRSSSSLNGRHHGSANVVFFDGHTASVEVTDALARPENVAEEPFWIGGTYNISR